MFYDERIEGVKGKIAKKAILIAFGVTFVLAQMHGINLLRNASDARFYWFAFTDAVIYFSTVIALMIGGILRIVYRKDERTELEQGKFYSKAAAALIKTALGALAFDLPIVLYLGKPLTFADNGPDGIIYTLLFTVGIYVVYSFRKNDIYFNYSIMDSDRYYKGVFKNVGKLGLYTLAFLGVSMISFVGVVVIKSPDNARVAMILWNTLAYYLGAFTEIALLYLLYSFLEKCSYNSEKTISRSTGISLGITILIYAVYTAGVIFVDSTAISQATAVQLVSIMSSFDIYIKLALLIFLTYFGYEYQRVRKNKLLSAGCVTILLSETLSVFIGQVVGSLIFVFMPEIMSQEAYIINQLFSTINVTIEDASSLANAVGFVLIIFALVKDKLICKAHRFALGAFAAFGGVELFLRTQVDVLQVNIYHFFVEIIVLCYFGLLVVRTGKKARETLS